MKEKEDILVQVGNLSRKAPSLLKAVNDLTLKEILGDAKPLEKPEKKAKKKNIDTAEEAYIIIGKERDIPYKKANCCLPA